MIQRLRVSDHVAHLSASIYSLVAVVAPGSELKPFAARRFLQLFALRQVATLPLSGSRSTKSCGVERYDDDRRHFLGNHDQQVNEKHETAKTESCRDKEAC